MTEEDDGGQIEAVPSTAPQLRAIPGSRDTERDFDQLFVDNYAFVCRILPSMGVPTASVEDVAQDVFVVLHRRFDDYDDSRDVRSWLWGIAKRVASTHNRTHRRAERKLRAVPDQAPPPSVEENLERRQKAEFVAEFLRKLPEAQREVFVLTEIEAMSAPEIAGALGIKLNTVYSRLRSARARFKEAVTRRHLVEDRERNG